MSSRQKDLAHLEQQIMDFGNESRGIQERFQKYNVKVTQRIRDILEKAGVWTEVNTLEGERAEASQKAQAKLQELNTQAGSLQQVRAFLLGRESEDPQAFPETEAKEAKSPEEEEEGEEWEAPTEKAPPEEGAEAEVTDERPEPPKF